MPRSVSADSLATRSLRPNVRRARPFHAQPKTEVHPRAGMGHHGNAIDTVSLLADVREQHPGSDDAERAAQPARRANPRPERKPGPDCGGVRIEQALRLAALTTPANLEARSDHPPLTRLESEASAEQACPEVDVDLSR